MSEGKVYVKNSILNAYLPGLRAANFAYWNCTGNETYCNFYLFGNQHSSQFRASRLTCGNGATCTVFYDFWNATFTSNNLDPTSIPTSIPSHVPSPSPTNFPSIVPSNLPTPGTSNNPSILPSNIPSSSPSSIPSSMPSSFPSNLPSNVPSNVPSDTPSNAPSNSPSGSPTTVPTITNRTNISFDVTNINSSYGRSAGLASSIKKNIGRLEDVSYYTIGCICLISVIITILAWIDSKCFRHNEMFKISTMFVCTMYFMDVISDVFFVIQSYYTSTSPKYAIIFALSAFFVIFPLFANIIQLRRSIMVWVADIETRGVVVPWLEQNIRSLYALSILFGSAFTAIEICHTNLFYLSLFNMGLNRRQKAQFKNKRLFSTVLWEV